MDRKKNDYYFNMFLNLIRATYLNVEKDWQNVASKVGLGYAQQHSLWILHVQDGLTLTELGNIAMWNKSTTSALISKLEKKGLVEKRPTDEGTREIRVYLTDLGRDLLEQSVNTDSCIEFMGLFRNSDEKELLDFLSELHKVCNMVGKSGQQDFNNYLDVYSKNLLKK